MTLYIKNMVCNRCIIVVKSILRDEGISPTAVELGHVSIKEELTSEQLDKLRQRLESGSVDF